MVDRRPELDDSRHTKRQKTEKLETQTDYLDIKMKRNDLDPKSNPYLAHMFDDNAENTTYNNGYGTSTGSQTVSGNASLAKFPRHATTAAMANKAEDGPNNPFSGKPLSQQYFSILKIRRSLPVHVQR